MYEYTVMLSSLYHTLPSFVHGEKLNPLPTNDAYMRHELPYAHKNLYGGFTILYRLFCFFKLFAVVGKGLIKYQVKNERCQLTVSSQASSLQRL